MRPPSQPPDGPPPRPPRPSSQNAPRPSSSTAERPSAGAPPSRPSSAVPPRPVPSGEVPARASRASVARHAEEPITLNISLGDEPASDLEKAEAIRDVLQHAASMAQEVALAKEMKSWPVRPITLAVLATLSLALSAYTFVGEPDWAFGPDPASVTPARHDAHLRFAMVLAAERVEAFRAATGALPATLAEVAEDWADLEYEPADSTFVLRAPSATGEAIVLESAADLKAFLGDSRRQLREQRQ